MSKDERAADTRKPNETSSDSDAQPAEAQMPTPSERKTHESELESALKLRDRRAEPVRPLRARLERARPEQPLAAQPDLPSLESLVPPSGGEGSSGAEGAEETEESGSDERSGGPLEERVTRSVKPEDLRRMRTLAERVYYEGWGRLSSEEQQAFFYHSRFLEYLSADERERNDIQSTMYRFVGAQGKSLGVERSYSTGELSRLTDRFFGAISTPFNRPDLYRPLMDTGADSYKPRERKD